MTLSPMQYRKFIKDVPPVSEIGLGAWQLGQDSGWGLMTEREAIALVREALELGLNFFDTSPNYGRGSSESRLGKALKGYDRSKVVINTKFGHTVDGQLNYEATALRKSLEGSLQRLQTDYVDSLILHNPPTAYLDGRVNAHYEILDRLIEEGKIKAYGASLDTYEDMKLFLDTSQGKVIEAFFNILHQDISRGFAQARAQEVGIIAKIPLDSGWLSGKYKSTSTFTGIRQRWSQEDIMIRAQLVDQVKGIVGEEQSLAGAALAFCLAHEAIATVIPGCKSIAQLKANVKSTQKPLAKEVVKKLRQFYEQEVKPKELPW